MMLILFEQFQTIIIALTAYIVEYVIIMLAYIDMIGILCQNLTMKTYQMTK